MVGISKYKATSDRDIRKAAKKVLKDRLGEELKIPGPGHIAAAIQAHPLTPNWGRKEQKREQLRAFSLALSWGLLIRATGEHRRYEGALRRHLSLPIGGNLLAYILRIVIPGPKNDQDQRDRATQRYAEWATGLRYLERKRISPRSVVKIGMHAGEGISVWAKRQRKHEKSCLNHFLRAAGALD